MTLIICYKSTSLTLFKLSFEFCNWGLFALGIPKCKISANDADRLKDYKMALTTFRRMQEVVRAY